MFRDIKPPFGQTNPTTTFGTGGFSGAATANPFGQTFGKTTTTGFAAPAFGSTGTSLFGSSAPTTGGLFGGATAAPVFGQAQTTQPSAFGFNSNTTGTGLFGAQQNAGTGLFGSSGTSAFGQNKPAFGSFGSTGTGLFGQQQQPQQPTQTAPSLFGQTTTNTGTGIFGTGGFGATTTTNATIGTPIKFAPVTGTDTMMKNGVTQNISTRHHCITCMKEYESKSLEELRLEDYMANRKGPQQNTQQPSLFGTSTGGSLFGAGASTSTGTGGIFTQDKPLFGSTSMGFGTSTGGVFGSTTQQSGSLFGKPGFGTMTTTTGTGFSFNTTTSANPFGASTQAKPFGTAAPQTGGLFGTATSQPSTFGTGTTGFPSFGTQQNQSIGLFNQNKPGFNMATTSSGFGFGTQNTTTNTGLFGSKPAGGLGFGTGTFGNTTTPSFGGGNMFGGNQNTSLFSQSFKPASTGFPFGQTTATTTSLGTGLNLGGPSLFGNTANKPGGLFGGNTGMFNSGTFGTTNTFGTGTGLGGMSTNLGGNPLLGGTTANPVANQQNTSSIHQQILSLASMPFGDSPLFRNLLPATGKTDELLNPTNPAAQKAILANNQFKVSPRGNARIKVKPLGAVALSKKSLFEGLEEEEVKNVNLTPRTNAKHLQLKENKSLLENSSSMATPERSTEANKENSILTDKALIEMNNNSWVKESQHNDSSIEEHPSPSTVTIPPYISPGRTNISIIETPPSQKAIRSSLNTEDKENSNNSTSTSDDSVEADEPAALIEDQSSHPTGIVLRRVGYYTIPTLDKILEVMGNDGSCVVENFTVGREGYGNVFFPGPLDVAGLNLDEIVHFRHKEVMLYPDDDTKPPVGQGLNRKAQVTLDRVWPMDKTTHQPITDPERLKQMDYEGKLRRVCAKLQTRFLEYRPQTGSWVFKVDHFSKYGLSDSDDDDDAPPSDLKKSKTAVAQQQAQKQPLKEILPKKVQLQQQQQQQLQQSPAREFSLQMSQGLSNGLMPHGFEKQIHRLDTGLLEDDQDMEEDMHQQVGMLEDISDDSLQKEVRSPTSPTIELSKELGASAHKVQLMKASFFADDLLSAEYMDAVAYSDAERLNKEVEKYTEGTLDQEVVPKLSKSFPIFRTQFSAQEPSPKYTAIAVKGTAEPTPMQITPAPSGMWMHPPVVKPKIAVLKHQGQMIPLEKSSVGHVSARCAADLGLMLGRSCRASWGKRSTLLTLNTQKAAAVMPLNSELSSLNIFLSGRAEGDCSHSIVQRLLFSGGGYSTSTSATFMESVEDHLKVQLKYSVSKVEDGCPTLSPQSGVDALHAHCVAAENLASLSLNDRSLEYSSEVWNLCVALWGSLPDLDESSLLHHKAMVRRLAVSEWLQTVVDQKVQKEVAALSELSTEQEPHVPVAFSLLTGRKIKDACERMQEAGDHYAAMLLSQVSSGSMPRQLLQHQLSSWHEVEADSFIYRERLKLLMLVAGIPLLESSHGTINVCENLDWKRAFAIHLWYMCSPISSVTDALNQYENAFGPPESIDAYARLPDPPYLQEGIEPEISSGLKVYDLCFHLLKLYSSRAYSLEQLLNPATHTADPLDYRLSWFLQEVLNALGYTHNSAHSEATIHISFALQLESQGQWHWAAFILLHMKDSASIKTAIFDLLGRNVELSDDPDYVAKEEFLRNDLKIPPEWIYEAKATLASTHGRHRDTAFYLIKAGQWQKSHEVIMEHIAADAIVNENYDYLRELLSSLVPPEHSSTIPSWNSRGQLLWDYLKMIEELESLLANQATDKIASYQLEKLQPQLTSLCSRINFFPCPTAMDRLCQSEIAKRTVHVVRNLLLLQKGQDAGLSRVLTYLVTQLPLPEDYAQQELRQVVSSCIAEFH